jgi:hypothetical protein
MMTGFWSVALAALVVATPTSYAAETIYGRWAADRAACGIFGTSLEQSPLTVSESSLRWHDDACRIARMYKTGDTVHMQAMCWGFAGERSVPVSLRPHNGKLTVTWDRARRADLRRCP